MEIWKNVRISFCEDQDSKRGKVICGISQVEIDGVCLMDPSFPSVFVLDGSDGWDYRHFVVIGESRNDDGYILKTSAIGTDSRRFWIRDQYNNDINHLGRPRTVPDLLVDFVFRPVSGIFGGHEFTGFSLSLQFSSATANLARMQWIQHWEIGGSIRGNKILHQSQISSPFHEMSEGSSWNNACWKNLEHGYGIGNLSMQFNSRCSYHQLFDFIYAEQGVMLGYFPDARSIQTLSQKNSGENNFFVFDVADFPVAKESTAPAKTILFSKTAVGMDETAVKNIWFPVNQFMENSYRVQTKIAKSRILPTELDGMWETVAVDGKLCFGDKDKHIPAEKYLEKIVDEKIPLLRSQGFRRFWTRPFCVSDTTELMFWNKTMRGRGIMDGDVAFGSCCCVWEYKPSKLFGGGKAARKFYETGHREQIDIGIWVGNHLSTKAPILREHPDWVLKDCNFANPTGGYDSHVLAVVNWNSGAREWILNDILDWKRLYGLDFIFFDSLGNLGLKTRNFADPELRDNFDGLCSFLSELTANGIEVICEGRSFAGSPYFSISSSGNMHSDNDPLIGQNSLSWFLGHEDMLTGIHLFTEKTSFLSEKEFTDMNFKIIANGGILKMRGCKISRIFDFYKIFNNVSDLMRRRELLPDRQGVLWRAENGIQLLFSYKTGIFQLYSQRKVAIVTPDGIGNPEIMDEILTEVHSVYLIT